MSDPLSPAQRHNCFRQEAAGHQSRVLERIEGVTLDEEHLRYVRQHPIDWQVPTHILYGENDNLTSFATISDFARRTGASIEVMPGGEHWFHTPEQMSFLDKWIQRAYGIISII